MGTERRGEPDFEIELDPITRGSKDKKPRRPLID